MNTIISKIATCGVLFLLTLVSGVILSNLGKPFNTVIFTIHKLVALGAVIVTAVNIYNLCKAVDIHVLYLAVFVVTGLLFLALIVSGALLSFDNPVPRIIALRIHQIAPLLALVFSAISIYLLVSGKGHSTV